MVKTEALRVLGRPVVWEILLNTPSGFAQMQALGKIKDALEEAWKVDRVVEDSAMPI